MAAYLSLMLNVIRWRWAHYMAWTSLVRQADGPLSWSVFLPRLHCDCVHVIPPFSHCQNLDVALPD